VYRSAEGWRPSSGHTDHVHISLSWNGARGNVSFWTGRTHALDNGPCAAFAGAFATPTNSPRAAQCAKPVKVVAKSSRGRRQFGHTGGTVAKAQRALNVRESKTFDRATWRAVRRYQKAHELPMTGALDHATWASLAPSTVTYSAVAGFSRKRAASYGLKHYGASTLRKGRAHQAVLFLQTALRMPRAQRTGFFGNETRERVRSVQKSAGLRVTGTVSRAEWQAIRDTVA
jgi:peptidoglycan hydrolase-like protein with peptidoglycan-binding domain